MAKGLAVISGSKAVIFKALENGVVQMGNSGSDWGEKLAQVTISGSLNISGSAGVKIKVEGSEFRIDSLSGLSDQVIISGSSAATATDSDGASQQADVGADVVRNRNYQLKGGLLWAATSSAPIGASEDKTTDVDAYNTALAAESGSAAPEDFLIITDAGELRRVNKIDASVVMLNDGQTVEQQVGGSKLSLSHTKHARSNLGGALESEVNLTKADLEFLDVENRTRLKLEQDALGSNLTVDLDPRLHVEFVSASAGIEATGSIELKGNLNATGTGSFDGDLSVVGKATVGGDMVVKGNLNVWGDTTVTTADSKHLSIEDAVINIGRALASGSEDPATGGVDAAGTGVDLGFVFGDSNKRALILSDGDFYLGKTSSDTEASNGVEVSLTDITLYVPNLSASTNLEVGGTTDLTGKLTAKANVDLGTSDANIVKIKGTLTASADALFEDHVTISGSAKSDLSITNGDLTVGGSGSFTGDLNVDGTGSFGKSVTLRSGADLTLDAGNATLTDGDLTISGSALISASAGNALHIANGDIVSAKGDLTIQDGNVAVTGSTVLSASAGSSALNVASGDVTIRDNLNITQGVVTLGNTQGALNVEGLWTQDAALDVKGALNVSGSVLLGQVNAEDKNSHSRVVVNGEFRIPKFSRSEIPDAYINSAADYEGYMFYLDDTDLHTDPNFPQGKKWYFNEGGVWHSSFFYSE